MVRCAECGFVDGEIRIGAKPCDTCTAKYRTSPTNNSSQTMKSLLTQNQRSSMAKSNKGKQGGTTPNQSRRKQTPKSTKVSLSKVKGMNGVCLIMASMSRGMIITTMIV